MKELIEYTMLEEQAIKAVEEKGGRILCHRCHNQKKSRFYKDEEGIYCEECLTFGKSSTNRWIKRVHKPSLPSVTPSLTKVIYLSDLQQIASRKCLEFLREKKDGLIFAVCGAGKTEIVYDVILQAIGEGKRVCFATPRKDVVLELLPRFKRDFSQVDIIALYGGSPDRDKDGHLILTTTHQLIHYYHFFDLILLDEVDAFPYYNNKMLESFIQKAKKPDAPIIYLTATPTKRLKQKMKSGKLDYFIIPSRFHKYPIPVPKVELVKNLKHRIVKGSLPNKILLWLKEKERIQKQVFIFVPSLVLGEKVEVLLKSEGFDCRFVCSTSKDRKAIVSLFREGKTQFIITTTILERGVTVPRVDVCILLSCDDIFDERSIVQIVGRAGRSKDDPTADVRLFCEDYTRGIKDSLQHIKLMNKRNERYKREGKE